MAWAVNLPTNLRWYLKEAVLGDLIGAAKEGLNLGCGLEGGFFFIVLGLNQSAILVQKLFIIFLLFTFIFLD